MHGKNIRFTKLTNNEFDTFIKLGINSMLDIENAVFTPNTLITQNSYCNEEDNDEEVKSTNYYYYSTEDFTKAKFKLSTIFSLFHLNIHSIQLHIVELKILFEIL